MVWNGWEQAKSGHQLDTGNCLRYKSVAMKSTRPVPIKLKYPPVSFDRSVLPDWEQRFCVNYEYARESCAFVENFKNKSPGTSYYKSAGVWVLLDFLQAYIPEFPTKSW